MEANNISASASRKICRLCKQWFEPHPKVKDRQQVCQRAACQRLRQQRNHRDWLRRNPVKYKTWNEDYGQTWRQQHPDYWKNYRRKKRMKPRPTPQIAISPLLLEALLQTDSGVKKEQLTLTKSVPVLGKKEQLTESFYLLKAKDLALWSLEARKKEQLPYCFNYN